MVRTILAAGRKWRARPGSVGCGEARAGSRPILHTTPSASAELRDPLASSLPGTPASSPEA